MQVLHLKGGTCTHHLPVQAPKDHLAHRIRTRSRRQADSRPPRSGVSEQQGTESQVDPVQSLTSRLKALSLTKETAIGSVVARPLGDEDTTAACLILTRAFAGTPEAIGFNDATKYFAEVQQNLPRGVLFVARLIPYDLSLLPPNQDSRLIGVVALSLQENTRQPIPTLPPPAEDAYLSNMAVDAKFRRLGVGRTLLELCDEAAKLAGKECISLHVRQGDSPANQLYLNNGYTEQARDNIIAAKLKQIRPRILMRRVLK